MTHLTLEQCKKLKEIGFPQAEDLLYWMKSDNDGWTCNWANPQYRQKYAGEEWYIACPVLEELMDFFGRDYLNLNLDLERSGDEWWATHYSPGAEINTVASGPNPLEAVYNLAIAIKSTNTLV